MGDVLYPKSDLTPVTLTVLSFEVDDLDKAMEELKDRVRFEHSEEPRTETRACSEAAGG